MKRILQTKLVFFCDDANGEWGVTHNNTSDNNYENGFNAFWDGIGIFHDVFEHYFERDHKYFMGDNAMNIGGEMAAMGHCWYYSNELGVYRRTSPNRHSIHTWEQALMYTTKSLIIDSIKYGYTNYGDTLESGVPRQKPVDSSYFEYCLEGYWNEIKDLHYCEEYVEERQSSERYKDSVKKYKLLDLHRWGYRQAERLIPNNYANQATLHNFIEYWGGFCKEHLANDLKEQFQGIIFDIYREKDEVSWKATLKSNYGSMMDIELTYSKYIPNLEELIKQVA